MSTVPQATAPDAQHTPSLTVPQWLAFAALIAFIGFTFGSTSGRHALITPHDLGEIRKLALFLIGALLPSDLLVRYGRTLLFRTVPDAKAAAAAAPRSTLAQYLAFATFVLISLLTLLPHGLVDGHQFAQIDQVARVVILALLPSDAGLRFGRALYYRSPKTPQPSAAQLARV